MSNLKSKILGGVYGQALGDAFCMPAFMTMRETRERFGRVTQFIAATDDHFVHRGFPAARITDDTEQAMWLARQIVADGTVSLEGAARAIVGWYDSIGGDNCAFVGPSTKRGVAKIKSGVSLNRTGIGGDTNGAAMRVSVVGLIHPGDVETAALDAAITSIPTHNTSVACSSASAVAGAVAHALQPNADLREVILAGMRAAEIGATHGERWIGANIARRIEFAVSLAKDPLGDDSDRLQAIYDLIGTGLQASEATPAAFGVVAFANGDPHRAAQLAFELSGDADTIGAMACAICGAFSGVESIPEEMRKQLRDANPNYDFDEIGESLYKKING